jgi:hypothetical protein
MYNIYILESLLATMKQIQDFVTFAKIFFLFMLVHCYNFFFFNFRPVSLCVCGWLPWIPMPKSTKQWNQKEQSKLFGANLKCLVLR